MLSTVIQTAKGTIGVQRMGGDLGGGGALREDFSEGMDEKRSHLPGVGGAHQVKDGMCPEVLSDSQNTLTSNWSLWYPTQS